MEYFRLASEMLWLLEQGQELREDQRKRFTELREIVRPHFDPRT